MILNESKQDQTVLRMSRTIINILKKELVAAEKTTKHIKVSRIIEGMLPFELKVKFSDSKEPDINNATVDIISGEIVISMIVPHVWKGTMGEKKYMVDLVVLLKQALRHELEHLTQIDDISKIADFPKVSKSLKSVVSYYTDEREIAAHAVEIYKAAKVKKTSFLDLIDDRLYDVLGLMKSRGATEDEAQAFAAHVKKSWIDYILKRYPNSYKFLDEDYD